MCLIQFQPGVNICLIASMLCCFLLPALFSILTSSYVHVQILVEHDLDEEGNNQWPDILKFLYDCCNAHENRMKEVALHIIM